jgi:rRNA maturation RNase YbeY
LKNLSVTVTDKHFAVNKLQIHKLVNFIKNYLSLKVDYLEINLVSSSEILEINTEHLNHNYTTDIITFNYSEIMDVIDAEIFISLHDCLNNSTRFKCSFNDELKRLIIHGMLHLIGFDDKTKKEQLKMRKKENELLEIINVNSNLRLSEYAG